MGVAVWTTGRIEILLRSRPCSTETKIDYSNFKPEITSLRPQKQLERPLRPNYTMKQTGGLVKVIY